MTAAAKLERPEMEEERPVVLVVDDEPQILESLEDLLEDDFEVLTATRGEVGLTLLRQHEVSVLLTDQRMPGVTGDELVRRARDHSRATRVLVTGYADLSALVRAVNDGQIYAYVSKPWKPVEMKLLVHKAADHYRLVRRYQEQNELLDRLMGQFPDEIYFKDLEGRFTRVNRAFAAAVGVDEPAWLNGRTQAELGDESSHREDLELMKTGVAVLDRVEVREGPSAERIWMSVTKLPLSGLGLVAVARDITERRRMAFERDVFFTNSLDLMTVCTFEGRFSQLNPAWSKTLGWSLEELRSQPFIDFVHPEDREETLAELERLVSERDYRTLAFENRYLHKDGSTRWLLWTAAAVAEDQRIYAAARDITARKEAEERLALQARQQRSLAGLGRLAIQGVDLQVLCEHAVESLREHLAVDCCGLFCVTPEGSLRLLAASGPVQYSVEDVPLSEADQLRYAIEQGKLIVSEDFRAERRFLPGRLLRLEAASGAAAVVKDPQDEPWGVLQILSLRPHVFREEDVHFLGMVSSLLSLAVRKRMAEEELELSQRQLMQSRKLEAIGHMAGGIAHDFNNLLTIVRGNAELLPPGEEVDEILEAVDRARALIEQLMTFARHQVVQPRPVELNQVMLQDQRLLARLVSEEVELKVVPATRPAWTVIDPVRLTQVLTNLVVNARDAIDTRGTITMTVLEPDEDRVGFCITDTGAGMSQEVLNRVFEPFFTTKPTGKGTGLGLATCYGIVHQAGGTLEVSSSLGEGTTFLVSLPAADAPSPLAARATEKRPRRSCAGTVLVVDDQEAIVRLIGRTLERSGLTVLQTSRPERALELARELEEPLDLLLTDMVMPRLSGLELSAQVRRLHPAVKVILMTGYSERLEEPGATGARVLAKPFSTHELLDCIQEALDD